MLLFCFLLSLIFPQTTGFRQELWGDVRVMYILSLSLHRVGERTMRKDMRTNMQNIEYWTSDLERQILNIVHSNIATS